MVASALTGTPNTRPWEQPCLDGRTFVDVTPSSSPYRELAAPAKAVHSRWTRPLVTGGGVVLVLAAAAGAGWNALPWKKHCELHAVKEALPPHERIASVWWSNRGWAVSVGAKGQVLVRDGGPHDADPWTWRALPPAMRADLDIVSGGTFWQGPTTWGQPESSEHAIVAGDGAILDCTPEACVPLATEGRHRAVAVAGGEALVVGDGGSLFRVVPSLMDEPRPWPYTGPVLHADRVTDLGLATDFRTVEFACRDDVDSQGLAFPRCDAVVTGADGVVVRGVRMWACERPRRVSGCGGVPCTWTWTRDPVPAAPAGGTDLQAWSPIDVVSTKLHSTRVEHARALLTFGANPGRAHRRVVAPLARRAPLRRCIHAVRRPGRRHAPRGRHRGRIPGALTHTAKPASPPCSPHHDA
jgi:hypothetical protein